MSATVTKRPNLFIVGAPKCGTTAWVSYLSAHPDVFFSPGKEPHYFCTDFPGFRWTRTAEEYEQLFAGAGGQSVIAEASVQYLYSTVAARNIQAYNPEARIVIFLRDQATFLPSYHNQLLYNLEETIPDFATVWRETVAGERRDVPATCREPAFLDYPRVGRFSEQVARYLDVFARDRIKVIRFEEWTRDPRRTYVELMAFLGIEDDGRERFEAVHEAKHYRSDALSAITQRPPGWVLAGARLVRRLTGRERLGLARKLRRVNSARGYQSEVATDIQAELQRHFAADNETLRRLLEPPVMPVAMRRG